MPDRKWRPPPPETWIPIAYAGGGLLALAGLRLLLARAGAPAAPGVPPPGLAGTWVLLWSAVALHLGLRRILPRLRETVRRLEESEARYRGLFETSPDAILIQRGMNLVLANEAAERLLGAGRGALVGVPVLGIVSPADHDRVVRRTAQVLEGRPHAIAAERQLCRLDGGTFSAEVRVSSAEHEGVPAAQVVIRDLSDLRRREAERSRLDGALRLLLAANEALVRARGETELLQEVCRASVESGEILTAWAGFAEHDAERSLRVVASAGPAEPDMTRVRLTWGDGPDGQGPAGTAVRSCSPCVVNDLAAGPDGASWLSFARRLGVGSALALPIVIGTERIGVLGFLARRPGAFDEPVVRLLRQLADDLAYGLEALRTRALLTAVLENAPYPVFAITADGRYLLVNRAWEATMALRREDVVGRPLSARGEPRLAADLRERARQVLSTGSPHRSSDAYDLPAGRRTLDVILFRVAAAGGPEAVGGIAVDVTERVDAAATLQHTGEQLRALAARLQTVREEEQARIARDLHDDLGQLLTGLTLDLGWLERHLGDLSGPGTGPLLDRAVAASELASLMAAAVRRIAADLRPGALDRLGLGAALRQRGRGFAERSGIACEVVVPDDLPPLPEPASTALWRICQEALTNVTRHADARQVRIELAIAGSDAVLTVEDDGRGIPPEAPERGLGLLGMRERATMAGGTLTWGAGRAGGAAIAARVPILPAPGGGAAA